MRPVICRQERVGVHMADGCARVTNGKPAGVFAMQYGPGAENAFAGIASAYSDSTPVLLLPLGHPRDTAQMFPLFNSTRTYARVVKHVEPVNLPEHTVAGDAARLQRAEERPPRPGHGRGAGRCDDRRIRRQRGRLHGGAADPLRRRPARHRRRRQMLLDAQSPIIIAGQGVLYAEATNELVALAELLHAR